MSSPGNQPLLSGRDKPLYGPVDREILDEGDLGEEGDLEGDELEEEGEGEDQPPGDTKLDLPIDGEVMIPAVLLSNQSLQGFNPALAQPYIQPTCCQLVGHIGNPSVSAAGKFLSVLGVTLSWGLDFLPAGGIGAIAAVSNFPVQYYFVSHRAAKPDNQIPDLRVGISEPLTCGDQAKAGVVLVSSLGEGLGSYYKTLLKTRSPIAAIASGLIAQNNHLQSCGQVWFALNGKDIKASWAAQCSRIFTFNVKYFSDYIVDIRWTVVRLNPLFQAWVQYMAVNSCADVFGVDNEWVLLAAWFAAASQYTLYKGYNQRIMMESLEMNVAKPWGPAWLIDKGLQGLGNLTDVLVPLPGEFLSAFIPAKYVFHLSNLVGGAAGGVAMADGGFKKLPENYKERIISWTWNSEKTVKYILGSLGVLGNSWSQWSHLKAGWKQAMASSYMPEKAEGNIGVEPLLQDTFGSEYLGGLRCSVASLRNQGSSFFNSLKRAFCCGKKRKHYETPVVDDVLSSDTEDGLGSDDLMTPQSVTSEGSINQGAKTPRVVGVG